MRALWVGSILSLALVVVVGGDQSCISRTNDLNRLERNADTRMRRTYILCANTDFNIGRLDYDNNVVSGQEYIQLKQNVHIKCGNDGRRENNCIVRGGDLQADATDFFGERQPATNIVLEGIIFSLSNRHSLWVTRPGSIRLIDCEFRRHRGSVAPVYLDHFNSTDQNSELLVSFEGCKFINNRYLGEGANPAIVTANSNQNRLNFERCLFSGNDYIHNNTMFQRSSSLVETSGPLRIVRTCFDRNQVGVSVVVSYGSTVASSNNFGRVSNGITCPFVSAFETTQQFQRFEPTCRNFDSPVRSCDEPVVSPAPTMLPSSQPSLCASDPVQGSDPTEESWDGDADIQEPSSLVVTSERYLMAFGGGSGNTFCGYVGVAHRFMRPGSNTWVAGIFNTGACDYANLPPSWIPGGDSVFARTIHAPFVLYNATPTFPTPNYTRSGRESDLRQWVMYYSLRINTPDASSDSGQACIGRATGSGHPENVVWVDDGLPVYCSNVVYNSNGHPTSKRYASLAEYSSVTEDGIALDATLVKDELGDYFLAWGRGAVNAIKLNARTGHIDGTGWSVNCGGPCKDALGDGQSNFNAYTQLSSGGTEAPFLLHRQADGTSSYILLTTWFNPACSSSEIRVSRSTAGIGGPYIDRFGNPLLASDSFGTLLLGGTGRYRDPGHPGVLVDASTATLVLTYQYRDSDDDGALKVAARELSFDDAGWPIVLPTPWNVCDSTGCGSNPPVPSPAPTTRGGGGGGFCFSTNTQVLTRQKGWLPIKALRLGDHLLTANNQWEVVYSFGHRNEHLETSFLRIHFAESTIAPLEVSPDHMVMINGNDAVPASWFRQGTGVLRITGELVRVTKVEMVVRKGLYAPFTPSGTIVVNGGVVASTYVAFQDSPVLRIDGWATPLTYQWLANAFEAPHRIYCRAVGCDIEHYGTNGVPPRLLIGRQLILWLLDQSALHQIALLPPVLILFGLLWLLERFTLLVIIVIGVASIGTQW